MLTSLQEALAWGADVFLRHLFPLRAKTTTFAYKTMVISEISSEGTDRPTRAT